MKSKSYSTPTSKNKGAETSQTGNVAPGGYLCGHKPQRAVATIPDAGNANGHEQRLAQGSRASICQRAVGTHPLPGYGPVISVNRPVRTSMLWCGGRGRKPPGYPIGHQFSDLKRRMSRSRRRLEHPFSISVSTP